MNAATTSDMETTRVERMRPVVTPPRWSPDFERTLRHTIFRGLCYTTREGAARLYAGGSLVTNHLAIVEHIGLARRLAVETRYDFILMAGPQQSQLDDIVAMAKGIHAAGRIIPPLYVDGALHAEVCEFLPLFAPQYGLDVIYRARKGDRINLR